MSQLNFRQLKEKLHGYDYLLLLNIIFLILIGLLMVYSASFIYSYERSGDGFVFIRKQLIYTFLGLILMVAAALTPYRKWYRWSYYLLGLSLVLVAAVFIPGIGQTVGGASRWIKVFGQSIQPVEFVKMALIFFLVRQVTAKHPTNQRFIPGIVAPLLLPIPALVLMLMQPDFGSVVIMSLTAFIILFLGGVRLQHLGFLVLITLVGGVALLVGAPYRMARLMAFLDPWADPTGKGFQILQSWLGIYHGGITGVGLGNGKEKLFYLPEAHNDFIFAVIGEELGMLGIVLILAGFTYFVFRGLRIAWKAYQVRNDRYAMLLACGITLLIGIQALTNMAVVLGLLPTKGLNLPFISYGGSALLMNLFGVGILLNISKGLRTQ